MLNVGRIDDARNTVWPLVKFDLEWVIENWKSEGFDLWEEVKSHDFYFNRSSYVYALNLAADFAEKVESGDSTAKKYREKANIIKNFAKSHWNGEFIYQSSNRQQDGSVIHAIATFGSHLFGPSSREAASTIRILSKTFYKEYPINQRENEKRTPGILIGRYPGDIYAGGNPWQLLTAAMAECFYLASIDELKSLDKEAIKDYKSRVVKNKEWTKFLRSKNGLPIENSKDLAIAQLAAGDAVLNRLWNFVKDDGGRIDEQIDKVNGAQLSAKSLTWSYANILHALHTRRYLISLLKSCNEHQLS